MNTRPWQGLLTGDYRHWGSLSSVHTQQFRRWVGQHQHVGIELEFPSSMWIETNLVKSINERYPYKGKRIVDGEYRDYNVLLTHNREIQVLFTCDEPMTFATQVRAFVKALTETGLTGLGSVHVNIQLKSAHYYPQKGTGLHYGYIHSDPCYRVENKFGPSFLCAEELIANLIVCVSALDARTNRVNEERCRKVAQLMEASLPGGILTILQPMRYAEGLIRWSDKL